MGSEESARLWPSTRRAAPVASVCLPAVASVGLPTASTTPHPTGARNLRPLVPRRLGYRATGYLVDATLAAVAGAVAGAIVALLGGSTDDFLRVWFLVTILCWPLQMATAMAITGGQTPARSSSAYG